MIMPDGTRLDLAQKSGGWCRECFGTGKRPPNGRWDKKPAIVCAGCGGSGKTGGQSSMTGGVTNATYTAPPCDVDYNV